MLNTLFETLNQFSDLEEKLCPPAELRPKPDTSSLVFGKYFTDHMLEVAWDSQKGWTKPIISPIHDLKLHPAAKVLHYAIEVCPLVCSYVLEIHLVSCILSIYSSVSKKGL